MGIDDDVCEGMKQDRCIVLLIVCNVQDCCTKRSLISSSCLIEKRRELWFERAM
jgi:hypothetical protein